MISQGTVPTPALAHDLTPGGQHPLGVTFVCLFLMFSLLCFHRRPLRHQVSSDWSKGPGWKDGWFLASSGQALLHPLTPTSSKLQFKAAGGGGRVDSSPNKTQPSSFWRKQIGDIPRARLGEISNNVITLPSAI